MARTRIRSLDPQACPFPSLCNTHLERCRDPLSGFPHCSGPMAHPQCPLNFYVPVSMETIRRDSSFSPSQAKTMRLWPQAIFVRGYQWDLEM